MTDELDDKIKLLEEAWERYHKDHIKYSMPDMAELCKLRIKRERLNKEDRWNV